MLEMKTLCSALEAKRPTVSNYIDLLEASHLIHRLWPFGYGKQVLRARSKVYLADAAIGPSVLLKGKALLEDAAGLARAVETAFFKHVFTRYYAGKRGVLVLERCEGPRGGHYRRPGRQARAL